MVKIEEGKFYKTRDGRKVGPIIKEKFGWIVNPRIDPSDGFDFYPDGEFHSLGEHQMDLIEEWSDTQEKSASINIITRRKIVHGSYGIVNVDEHDYVSICEGRHTPDELREAAHILNQIAECLEGEK